MRRRPWRRVVPWSGCTLCVLIAAVFLASGRWWLSVQVPTPYGPAAVVAGGGLYVTLDHRWDALWRVRTSPMLYWDDWTYWEVGSRFIFVPLYAVFVAVALPTLLVWRFGPKRVRPGHCACGYNLTGLTEASCPECGQQFEPRGDAP